MFIVLKTKPFLVKKKYTLAYFKNFLQKLYIFK